ncbi:MAG: copper-binding protein [Pseudomonadota bacterium]
MKNLYRAAAVVAFTIAGNALAQGAGHAGHHPSTTAAAAPQSEGEVRKVDLEQGKVTLRHGPLVNLDMPAMTMVFTAADPRSLDGLKQGDQVRFNAEKKDGSYVVTAIEAAR